MNESLLRLYHSLPAPVQTLAATTRGLYLRAWRYGPQSEALIRNARARERWNPAQWNRWQQARLAGILDHAARAVPYYREHWQERYARGDRSSATKLENWPVLEKETLRAAPHRFVADGIRTGRLYHEHTSGTTGKPVDLYRPVETVRQLYALSELRERRWYGVSVRDRWAILGGQLVAPVGRRRPPFWVWNAALNQLYMSSYHLAPDLVGHYLDALRAYRITYLWGYASALYELALEALRRGRRDLAMTVAITNAEPLYDHQRQVIADAFQCPVRETYGMAELVMSASECEAGRLHLWPEVGVVEVHGAENAGDMSGDFVCTGLLNPAMPLIRYRVGDRGALAPSEQPCACGRTLPVVDHIAGRQDDVVYTRDGRRVGRLDPVFKAKLPIHEAQIVQETLDRIRVRVVPAPGFDESASTAIRDRMRARVGPMDIIVEAVAEIPRTAQGKFRAVVSALPAEERQVVGAA